MKLATFVVPPTSGTAGRGFAEKSAPWVGWTRQTSNRQSRMPVAFVTRSPLRRLLSRLNGLTVRVAQGIGVLVAPPVVEPDPLRELLRDERGPLGRSGRDDRGGLELAVDAERELAEPRVREQVEDRERLRQRHAHALERLAQLVGGGQFER